MEVICGIFNSRKPAVGVKGYLHSVSETLSLTNPKYYIDNHFGFSINRTITDPKIQSANIFLSQDKATCIALTGGIINDKDLVDSLGLKYPSLKASESNHNKHSDTDLVYHLYKKFGLDFVSKLNGIFNIVIWDIKRLRLFLVTDRFGLKPFYYHFQDGNLVFGSCIKTILMNNSVDRVVNLETFDEFLRLGFSIPPQTLFKNINILTAGNCLELGTDFLKIRPYAGGKPKENSSFNIQDARHIYLKDLKKSIKVRIKNPGETGVFLSGGVDSSAIVSLMHESGIKPIKTYSLHLNPSDPETQKTSRYISDLFKTQHSETTSISLDEILHAFPSIAWHWERPFVYFWEYFLCQRARQEVGTIITGFGNDSIWGFLGSKLHFYNQLKNNSPEHLFLLREGRQLIEQTEIDHLLLNKRNTQEKLLDKIRPFSQGTGGIIERLSHIDGKLYGEHVPCKLLANLLMHSSELTFEHPYLDNHLMAFIESLSAKQKLFFKENNARIEKHFFKKALDESNCLPHKIIYQTKKDLYNPTQELIRGKFGQTVQRMLLGKKAVLRNICDYKYIDQLWKEHQGGAKNRTTILMLLFTFELWHKIFIETKTIAKPDSPLPDLLN